MFFIVIFIGYLLKNIYIEKRLYLVVKLVIKEKKVHKEYQITKKSFIFPGWHTDLGMYLEKAMRMSRLLPESDQNPKIQKFQYTSSENNLLKSYSSNCITQIMLHCLNAPSFYNYFQPIFFCYLNQKVISMIFQK